MNGSTSIQSTVLIIINQK